MPVPVERDRVIEFFKKNKGPQKAKDVGKALGLSADDRAAVRSTLNGLASEGILTQLEGRRYVLAGAADAHRGTVQRKASGSGWFIPEEKKVGDAFLPAHELLGVVDGDRVLVRLERAPKGPVAKIVRVLERRRTTLTGVLKDSGKAKWVECDDNVMSGPIVIPPGPEGNGDLVKDGEVVEVLLVEYPTPVTTAVGRIVRSLGQRGKLDVEIERILAEKKIVNAFPPEVDAAAAALPPNPSAADHAGREDVRALPLVTIDGETAKDFDDAVHGKRSGKDIVVTVAIADVSHYVREGAPLDVEAARRGTSIYYPGRVIPMLPEALSNGLCSLKPDVERLCMVVEFTVRPDGSPTKQRFYNGVMKSHARLTYTLTQKFFDGDPDTRAGLTSAVKESLIALDEASQRLRKARQARGALDFDLPETVIALDDTGEPVKIHAMERLNAHKLIEDLMVAANEAVAEKFEARKWPCVYRIHEQPDSDKLERFVKLAQLMAGRRIKELESDPSPKALMEVMKALADIPGRRALDSLLLRSMMQAKYSAENLGHYGLGSGAYLHFTSPIRRYPDLVVHRLLKDRIAGSGAPRAAHKRRAHSDGNDDNDTLLAQLDAIAAQSSDCERTATDIERAIDALHAAWFMKDRVGEEFDGLVQGVAEFGLFMQLVGAHVEGMVRVADLGDDYYTFDEVRLRLVGERTGRVFGIGDQIKVRVFAVDVARRQIGLVLAGAPAARPAVRGGRGQGRASGGDRGEEGARGRGGRGRGRGSDERGARGRGGEGRGGRGGRSGGERPSTTSGAPSGAPGAAAGERPKIRGPEDLRRIFEEKSKGRGGGGGGKKKPGGRGGSSSSSKKKRR